MAETYVDFPVGDPDIFTPASAANITVNVRKLLTILKPTQMAAAMEIDLVLHKDLRNGARLLLVAQSDGTARNVTFGDGFTAPVLAGVISKTKAQCFVYDGNSFIAEGAAIQLD